MAGSSESGDCVLWDMYTGGLGYKVHRWPIRHCARRNTRQEWNAKECIPVMLLHKKYGGASLA